MPSQRLSFSDWLSLQSAAETLVTDDTGSVSTTRDTASRDCSLGRTATQKPFRIVTSLADCRAERRNLVNSRGKQDVMLTLLPPPHVQAAPLNILLEQVDKILSHVTEPLISLHIGELSRSLYPNPKQLTDTGEAGVLQLWLTAASALNLVWVHQRQRISITDSAELAPVSDIREVWRQTTQVLATVPLSCSSSQREQPHLSGWRLKQDPSGRSFCLQLQHEVSNSCSELGHQHWYFWARSNSNVTKIGQLLALIQSPPSLAELSGVCQSRLDEIACWTAHVHQAIASAQQPIRQRPAVSSSIPRSSPCLAAGQQPEAVPSGARGNLTDSLSPPPGSSTSCNGSDDLESSIPINGKRIQVTAVQGATASAFMTEPAWGIAQTLTVHARVGVCVSGVSGNSADLLCQLMAHAALLAKHQAEASAQQEAERLGWQRLEALAAQKAVTLVHQRFVSLHSMQLQRTVEAFKQRLQTVERRRCRDHPSGPSRQAVGRKDRADTILMSWRRNTRTRAAKQVVKEHSGPNCDQSTANHVTKDVGIADDDNSVIDQQKQLGPDDQRKESSVEPGTPVDMSTLHMLLQ